MKWTMRKILNLIFMAAMVMGLLCFGANAADIVASGYCGGEGDGTNLTWTLDNEGTLTISGTGAMADYEGGSLATPANLVSDSHSPWLDYQIRSVLVEEGVTSIGNSAFQDCCSLTSMELPVSVNRIGNHAFNGCHSLTSIAIPNNVATIGDLAFYCCEKLTRITIPGSVRSIGDWAFYHCKNLTSVTILGNATSIGSWVFYRCENLTNVAFEGNVPSDFGKNVFTGCANGLTILVPIDDITWTSSTAYQDWNQTWNGYPIVFDGKPQNIIASGYCGAEGDCSNLTWTLDDEGTLTISGTGAMADYDHYDSTDSPWYPQCDSICSVIIGANVTSIGSEAFYACTNLNSIVIGSSVTSIGDRAFAYCASLKGISIPNSVTSIGTGAFYDCSILSAVRLPSGLTAIRDRTFYECYNLSEIPIPDCVTSIGNYSFYRCTSLTSISLPASVSSVGSYAFSENTKLISILIPDGASSSVLKALPNGVHILTKHEAKAETCTEDGNRPYYSCHHCNQFYSDVLCKAEVNLSYWLRPATGHSAVTSPEVPATCTEPGLTEGCHCERCGLVLIPQEYIAALGHQLQLDEAVTPTCEQDGCTAGMHCSVCGEIFLPQEILPAPGHQHSPMEAVPATCTEPGLTEGLHCSVCGEVFVAQEVIPASGHHYTLSEAVPATCTEPGLKSGFHCPDCGEVFIAQEPVPALGHDWVLTDEVPGLRKTYTCSRCHETKDEFMLLPDVRFPAGWALLTVDSGEALVCVSTDAPATAILASYDASGRFLSSRVITLQPGYTEQTLAVSGAQSALFLLDENGVPLCASITK